MRPNMISVQSSSLFAVGYDEASQALFVTFNPRKDGSQSTYRYDGVPADVYNALMAAPSVGTYFGANVKPNYPFTKLED